LTASPRGNCELAARDEDLVLGEVCEAAGVIGMQMRHHDPTHIGRFAHGMTILELNRRFPPDADLDAAWEQGIRAFMPKR
jgi:hypothetical protein